MGTVTVVWFPNDESAARRFVAAMGEFWDEPADASQLRRHGAMWRVDLHRLRKRRSAAEVRQLAGQVNAPIRHLWVENAGIPAAR
jgi:hypothetical protein